MFNPPQIIPVRKGKYTVKYLDDAVLSIALLIKI